MEKSIKVKICVQLPYDSDLLNNVEKLNERVLEVLNNNKKFSSSVEAGYDKGFDRMPINYG